MNKLQSRPGSVNNFTAKISVLATIRIGLESVTQSAFRGSRNAVFAVLAVAALPTGECWPSQQTLRERTGFSVRTVRRCLRDLESVGLKTTRRQRYETNLYDLSGLLEGARARAGAEERIRASQRTRDPLCKLQKVRQCRQKRKPGFAPYFDPWRACEAPRGRCKAGLCLGRRAWRSGRCATVCVPEQGLTIATIASGQAAQIAGLLPGDELLSVGGCAIETSDQLREALRTQGRCEDRARLVDFEIARQGKRRTLAVAIPLWSGLLGAGVRPRQKFRGDTLTAKGSNSVIGLTKSVLSPETVAQDPKGSAEKKQPLGPEEQDPDHPKRE